MDENGERLWITEAMNWEFMNEGSSHAVFKGINQAKGWVLKLEKTEFSESKENSEIYQLCDASLSRMINMNKVFKPFLPKSVFLCNF
jgi:hypothetical protein